MNSDEFNKRFHTCAAKFNLIFAYHSSLPKENIEKLDLKSFALARNYTDFCYLDMQRVLLLLYKEQEPELFEVLEKKLDALDEFLTQVLKDIDNIRK